MDTDAALVRLEAKLDALSLVIEERLKGVEGKIDFGDRSALQSVSILADSIRRAETIQADHAAQLRLLDSLPERMPDVERRLGLIERDRAKLIGFLFGAAAAGGGVGAAVAQFLGGAG